MYELREGTINDFLNMVIKKKKNMNADFRCLSIVVIIV